MDASHADIARLLNSTENDRLKGLDMLLLYNEKDGDDGDHATASLSDPDSPPPSDDEDEVTTQRACAIGIDEVVAGKENVEVDDLLNEAGKFSCKCKHFPGKEPCSNYFSADEFATSRMNMASIPFRDQNMLLLGVISAGINISKNIVKGRKDAPKDRRRPHTVYLHQGRQLCISTFRFLYG
ncbi:hypothetical protein CAPTEDRAFT_186769, partial [Capitella teleta]